MRLLLALWVGKLIFFLSRLSKKGGGSAAPGYYALKICPTLISSLTPQIPQNIVITGTNGKTTTARLLAHFVKAQKVKVIRNSTGSNLARGIASTLISHSSWSGQVKADLGIWELDESAFNSVVFELKPQMMVFLNAFRDQLDRYGEVDSVVKKWQASLKKVDWETAIIVNGGDNHTWSLMQGGRGKRKGERKKQTSPFTLYPLPFYEFRVKDHEMSQEKKLTSNQKHQDDFMAKITKNKGLLGLEFDLKYPDGQAKVNLPIPGIYHVYDFLAAFSVYYLLNLPLHEVNEHLQSYLPAFGRVEKIELENNEAYIFLIKNPTGATEVFNTIAPEITKDDRLLIALNDNFADGKDVSWIWDASFEQLSINNKQLSIISSGTRAQDLAVRLKYAGVDPKQLVVENGLNKALSKAQDSLKGRLFILPTYTALLELQNILAKSGVKSHYWQES